MTTPATTAVHKHRSAGGIDVYSISTIVFDNFRANVYLLDHPRALTLIDTGSGMGSSDQGILDGLSEIALRFGRHLDVQDVELILITHGHIDHFGGLPFLTEAAGAAVWVHPEDRQILADFATRVESTVLHLDGFLQTAGIPPDERHTLLDVYRWGKDHYRCHDAHPLLAEGVLEPLGLRVIHTPGHCPGQVCLQLDDILFSGDHVLARISPHLAPASITPGTGLRIYLDSLRRVAEAEGVRMTLGGHESPIEDLRARCQEIEQLHWKRLDQVERLCRQPRTLRELSRLLFGTLRSYHILLGLEEAGALAEFLVEERRLLCQSRGDGTWIYSAV